ncbi:MAG TPA: hypothetical protein VGH19_02940 [Verrucomicrobiae bacterium]
MKTQVSNRKSSCGALAIKLSIVCTLIVLVTLGLRAANKGNAKAGPTEEYWKKLHASAGATDAEQILADLKQTEPTPQSLEKAAQALIELATQLDKTCQQIAALPALNVDPELLQYSASYMKAKSEGVIVLNEYSSLLLQSKELLSGDNLLLDFLFSTLKHSDKGNDALGYALREQLSSKGGALDAIKPRVQQIYRQAMDVRNQVSRLKADEMQLRLNLTKKYAREFAPISTFKLPTTSALKKIGAVEIPATKMQQDLLGKSINDGLQWNFEDMQEYTLFHVIKSTQLRSDSIQYQVVSKVKGIRTGNIRTIWLNLEYRQQNGQWNLTNFVPF